MRRIRAFAAALLAVVAFVFSSVASASFPPPTEYLFNSRSGWHPTVEAACRAELAMVGPTYVFSRVVNLTCYVFANSAPESIFGTAQTRGASCPSGSTLSGGQCTCTAPNIQNTTNNGCFTPDDAACNNAALIDSTAFGVRDIQVAGVVSSGTVCLPTAGTAAGAGCNVTFKRDVSYALANGTSVSEGTYQRTTGAGSCSLSTAPVPAAIDTCKGGQPGTVNGVSVCIPFSGTGSTTEKTKVTTTPSANGPVSTTTSDTTVCTGAGSCTTTTTTSTSVNGAAPTTSTATTTQSKADFCAANKSASECGGGAAASGFSGSCIAGFIGTGDALQKATAEAVNKTNCLLDPGTSTASVSEALAAGTFGPELSNTNRAIGQFDQSNPLGSSCPPDVSLTIMSATVVIPLSQACWALQALGYIAVAFTLLYSTIFVVKGF